MHATAQIGEAVQLAFLSEAVEVFGIDLAAVEPLHRHGRAMPDGASHLAEGARAEQLAELQLVRRDPSAPQHLPGTM